LELSINGKTCNVNFASLGDWASAELGDAKGIAIAVNDCVVPSSKWNTHALNEGDKILVVTATCGG